MQDILDIQRDHEHLINQCMNILESDGILYFSNNLRSFKMSHNILEKYHCQDLSLKSIPDDFRDKKIHKLFTIRHLLKD